MADTLQIATAVGAIAGPFVTAGIGYLVQRRTKRLERRIALSDAIGVKFQEWQTKVTDVAVESALFYRRAAVVASNEHLRDPSISDQYNKNIVDWDARLHALEIAAATFVVEDPRCNSTLKNAFDDLRNLLTYCYERKGERVAELDSSLGTFSKACYNVRKVMLK